MQKFCISVTSIFFLRNLIVNVMYKKSYRKEIQMLSALSANFNPRQNQPAFGMKRESAEQILLDIDLTCKDSHEGYSTGVEKLLDKKKNKSPFAKAVQLLADQLSYSCAEKNGSEDAFANWGHAVKTIKMLALLKGMVEGFGKPKTRNEVLEQINQKDIFETRMKSDIKPIEGYKEQPEPYSVLVNGEKILHRTFA